MAVEEKRTRFPFLANYVISKVEGDTKTGREYDFVVWKKDSKSIPEFQIDTFDRVINHGTDRIGGQLWVTSSDTLDLRCSSDPKISVVRNSVRRANETGELNELQLKYKVEPRPSRGLVFPLSCDETTVSDILENLLLLSRKDFSFSYEWLENGDYIARFSSIKVNRNYCNSIILGRVLS